MTTPEFEAFDKATDKILSVSKDELKRREEEWKKETGERGESGSLRLRLPSALLLKGLVCKRRYGLTSESGEGKALTYDLGNGEAKPAGVTKRFAIVVAEYLFIKIAKKMKGLDADIGSFQSAFQKAPEVFEPVGVNLAVNVLFGMVDNSVIVVLSKALVGFQRIGVERRSWLDMRAHLP